jgi:hypothetical protein
MVAQAACLFDTDGVDIRFLNSNKEAKFHNVDEARAIIDRCKFLYATPLATSLFNKILTPMLIKPAEQGTLQKPLHVIVITDGEPCHDEMNLSEVISKTKAILDKTRCKCTQHVLALRTNVGLN